MAKLSEQELLFLSNLMHMKNEDICDKDDNLLCKSPFKNIWTESNFKRNNKIGDIIKTIDTNELRTNPYLKDYLFDGEITGAEWADMIDAMMNSDICDLKIKDIKVDDKKALYTCLKDKEGNTYVVFRGTSSKEWPDNFNGAFLADTEQQKKALDYVNSLGEDHITVVGHSKGGNKAKYVALLSDKVDRCVSFDGQGFSQYFMEKYQDLIEQNKSKITCYALDNDFVNILLYDIYNTKTFIKGSGITDFKQNHSPNSFYQYRYYINDAQSTLQWSNYWETSNQGESMVILHSFVNYVASTISSEDRESFFSFLGKVADKLLGDGDVNGAIKILTSKENSDELGLLVAYLIKYEEYNDGITDAVLDILDSIGLSDISKWVRLVEKHLGTEKALKFLLKKHKQVIIALKIAGAPEDAITIFDNIAKGYEEKKDVVKEVKSTYIKDYNVYENDIQRDYTQERREKLLRLTNYESNDKPYDVKKWDHWYRTEDWFQLLDIDYNQNKIDEYYSKVIDINEISHQQLIRIFDNVDSVVSEYKSNMEIEINNLKELNNKILNL